MAASKAIVLENITKRFPGVTVIDKLDLEIDYRDFSTLLGPSGCGKTTTLRIIAGLEEPDEGDVWIHGKLVYSAARGINVPPSERNLGMIFQSYALWPHMTVYQNVSFGLEGKMNAGQIRARVADSLRQVRLTGYDGRYPAELSGGQQQRVAVARMLAAQPKILLMDEPLSNLDAKLRMQMRAELKRMHNDMDVTVVYVTHDQEEALTLSSRVAVMNEGIVEQYAPPGDVYRFPASLFVADFIGNPQMNFLSAKIQSENGRAKLVFDQGSLVVGKRNVPSGAVVVGVRPEDLSINRQKVENALLGRVYAVLPAGSSVILHITLGDDEIIVRENRDLSVDIDAAVWISFDQRYLNLYDKDSRLLVG